MKAFVLTLLLVLAPAIIAQNGTLNTSPQCTTLECPDGDGGSTTTLICDCPKCDLKCEMSVVNDQFSPPGDAYCTASGGASYYLDGKLMFCGPDEYPPAIANDESRSRT